MAFYFQIKVEKIGVFAKNVKYKEILMPHRGEMRGNWKLKLGLLNQPISVG